MTAPAEPGYTYTHKFEFTPPPDVLVPGETVTITAKGSIAISQSAPEYIVKGVGKSVLYLTVSVWDTSTTKPTARRVEFSLGDSDGKMEVLNGQNVVSKSFSFLVPADVAPGKEVRILIDADTFGSEIEWVYRAG